MRASVTVARVQAYPAVLDQEATLDKLAALVAWAAAQGAELLVFPETFVFVYPSSAWAKALAGQRASAYPDDFPLRELIADRDVIGRGGSAILAPDGSYLAGPLYGEEGILYATLDPAHLVKERQRSTPPATTTAQMYAV